MSAWTPIADVIADTCPPRLMTQEVTAHVSRFAAELMTLCQGRGGAYVRELPALEQAAILLADGHPTPALPRLCEVLTRVLEATIDPLPGDSLVDGLSVRALTAGWRWAVSPCMTAPRALRLYGALVVALRQTPGDIAEFGVATGETAREMIAYLEAAGSGATAHLFDTYTGLPTPHPEDAIDARVTGRYAGSEAQVRETLREVRQFVLYPGRFAEGAAAFEAPLAFAHIDADLYTGTRDALAVCQRCVVPGGLVVVDDYGTEWTGVTRAVDAFTAHLGDAWTMHGTVGQAVLQRVGDAR